MNLNQVDEVADRVFRLGTRHANWYVVVDGSSITVVDAGLPRYWPQLEDLLTALGRSVTDIEAVLLTHADPDHLGNAERIATEAGATVVIHAADIPAVTKQVRISPPRVPLWRPAVLSYMGHALRNRMLSWQAVSTPAALSGDAKLDVPGRPTAIHTPGHTPGSVCYTFDGPDVAFVGDALFNVDPITGADGCIATTEAFSADHAQALESLDLLRHQRYETVLFGHGNPRPGGLPDAIAAALGT